MHVQYQHCNFTLGRWYHYVIESVKHHSEALSIPYLFVTYDW